MTTKLIINADDYGLTPGVNQSIRELLLSGCISSTSLMANLCEEEELEKLRLILQEHRGSAGLHVNLTLGEALSGPSSLTDNRGLFLTYRELRTRLKKSKVRYSDICMEINAQINKIKRSGIQPTHVDSHQHIHAFPQVFWAVCECARHNNAQAMRTHRRWSINPSLCRRQASLSSRTILSGIIARIYAGTALALGMKMPQYLVEISEPHWKTAHSMWRLALDNLPQSVCEIFVHPGYRSVELSNKSRYVDEREAELSVLAELPKLLALHSPAIQLISYAELP